ncbi:MAG: hypothetical protein HZB50_10130 [Chloroflexi bacterium]|nr:hypothetical protein [Chloroflexota bacterium]
MKKLLYILVVISLVGCQTAEAIPTQTVIANTPTLFLTSTPTNTPTTIPTSTPSSTPKTCPAVNPDIKYHLPEDPYYLIKIQSITHFLNAGGDPNQLSEYFTINIENLNNDSVPDILVQEGSVFKVLTLFSCINGNYEEQLVGNDPEVSDIIDIMAVKDFNRNGVPEVFYKELGCFGLRCGGLGIIEWDGEKFSRILKDKERRRDKYVNVNSATMSEPQDVYLKDLDGDGIPEFVWTGEVTSEWHGDHWLYYPQRLATHIYKWDGENYSALPVEYASPAFRFQAVQDGDRFSSAEEYQKALGFYKMAINNNDLGWWSEDRWLYINGQHGFGPCANSGTPCPPPTPDPKERPILSAYATFRVMLVHVLTNNLDEAEKTYQRILKTYPVDNLGFPIAEMATSFWNEYQASQNIAEACAQSITYITKHTDVLTILEGAHSGQQIPYKNHPYEVCPFK